MRLGWNDRYGPESGRRRTGGGVTWARVLAAGTGMATLLAALAAGTAWGAAAGEYTINSLPAAPYRVSFRPPEGSNYLPQYYNGKEDAKEADLVSITPPAIATGINAALATGGQISGKVTAASGGAPASGAGVCAYSSSSSGCATANGAGEYTIAGLGTGQFTVVFFPERNNLLEQFYNGKLNEEEADLVNVTVGSTTTGIDAALATGGQITGKVTDAITKAAVANVTVCPRRVDGNAYVECATTDAGGEYTIFGAPTGEYTLVFYPEEGTEYALQYYNNKAKESEATHIAVTAGETTSGINVALKAGGVIQGTLTGAGSKAPVGGQACAINGEFFGQCATANPNTGQYSIEGLRDDEYVLSFSSRENNLLPQYYNGKSHFEEANKVSVKAGETKTGIDAALATGGRITGRITAAATGAPLANAYACAGFRCHTTNSNGEYDVFGLPTGSYIMSFETEQESGNFMAQYYNGKPTEEEADLVAVNAGETVGGINAALQPGGQIAGTVTAAAGGAPLAGATACVTSLSESVFFSLCVPTGAATAEAAKETPKVPAPIVPNSAFSLATVKFNQRTGILSFVFTVANAGKFSWHLAFRNADVGFADSAGALARSKRCKHGYVRHHGRCVRLAVPFGSGAKTVASGKVEIKVHASAAARRALKAGRTLHVSGPFTFRSALGGSPTTHAEHVVIRGKKHKKHHT
jgi:hypothetical protein